VQVRCKGLRVGDERFRIEEADRRTQAQPATRRSAFSHAQIYPTPQSPKIDSVANRLSVSVSETCVQVERDRQSARAYVFAADVLRELQPGGRARLESE